MYEHQDTIQMYNATYLLLKDIEEDCFSIANRTQDKELYFLTKELQQAIVKLLNSEKIERIRE